MTGVQTCALPIYKLGGTGLFQIASLSKESKTKDKIIHLAVVGSESLSKVAAITVKNIREMIGKTCITMINQ